MKEQEYSPVLLLDEMAANTEGNEIGYAKVELNDLGYCVRVVEKKSFAQLFEARLSRRASKRMVEAVIKCVYATLEMEGGAA